MDNSIEDIRTFLQWYKNVYGNDIFINGELVESSVLTSVVSDSQDSSIIEKNAPSDIIIHQGSTELEEYYLRIKDCQKCPLGAIRKNFVFGLGNPNAELMFIGEAPGKEEDEQGIPFVGRAGKLLDRMLKTIGFTRDQIFIANVLKCRPPNNRDPLPEEVIKCEPYLKKQLKMISPKVLIALGRISGQVLLKQDDPLYVLREKIQQYEDIPLIVTYHPAALLRNPQWKQNAWEDLKKIKKILKK